MDMGILKPFDVSRSASSGNAQEVAAAERTSGKQMDAALISSASRAVETQTKSAPEQGAAVDRDRLQSAVSDMQDFVQSVRRDINFQLDDTSGRVVINVTEATSGDVIRQIPSEEALRLAENLSEVRSLLFEAEA